jgi:hypothetical protein
MYGGVSVVQMIALPFTPASTTFKFDLQLLKNSW